MIGEREVKGAISWRSVASRLGLGKSGAAVREFMDPAPVLPSDASLFTAIPLIADNQYVLVRGPDQKIVGIITATDLSLQFQTLAEPYLLLGEIENHVRRVLHQRFDAAGLAAAKDPSDTSRSVTNVTDMTFGEYIRLLETPANWAKLSLAADRATFVDRLKQIRDIRNDVMHFDPDPIPPDDLKVLRDFARFLQRLQDIGAT
jgi:CBS domain protein